MGEIGGPFGGKAPPALLFYMGVNLMGKCINIDKNLKACNCSYEPCSRKGMCCECLRYHLSNNELPACFFPPEVERTYDRSISRFLSLYKG